MTDVLTWNVFIGNFNTQRIEPYNVFRHGGFLKACRDDFREWYHKLGATDLDKLRAMIQRELQYYFWSKCEWEIVLSGWPPSDRFQDEKIDVYRQIMLNFPIFFSYLWEHRYDLLDDDPS